MGYQDLRIALLLRRGAQLPLSCEEAGAAVKEGLPAGIWAGREEPCWRMRSQKISGSCCLFSVVALQRLGCMHAASLTKQQQALLGNNSSFPLPHTCTTGISRKTH